MLGKILADIGNLVHRPGGLGLESQEHVGAQGIMTHVGLLMGLQDFRGQRGLFELPRQIHRDPDPCANAGGKQDHQSDTGGHDRLVDRGGFHQQFP